MTGKFSIKRRKQDTPRPSGQNSQLGVLAALGIGVGRSSPHVGSKRGYDHLTDPGPGLRFARAQEWHARTGRPLPPSMRVRRPLEPPAAMTTRQRFAGYFGYDVADLAALSVPDMTRPGIRSKAQRRRLLHKAGSHGERPAGWQPDRPQPAPRAPRTPAQRARARKNAVQQARHLRKLGAQS